MKRIDINLADFLEFEKIHKKEMLLEKLSRIHVRKLNIVHIAIIIMVQLRKLLVKH